jgi:ubiquitin C-terminal hydrolase
VLCCCPLTILFIFPNISGCARIIMELKECLLAELQPADRTSDVTASGEGYDENLYSLMQTFWEMFDSGQITQKVTCTICRSIITRVEPFSKVLLQFPESHHEATPTNQKCTLNSLIKHYHIGQEELPDYHCNYCGKRTLATHRVQISLYPVILCIVLGCKKNDETRITSAVDYLVWDLNLCTIFGSHEGAVDSKYNLIATVNHRASKKNDGHYTAVSKSPMLGSWYKYDNDNFNLVKFMKRINNFMLMDFQKTASILFYINVRYVSVCYNNLHNDDEVIDRTGGGIEMIHRLHEHPPSLVQLEDNILSLS